MQTINPFRNVLVLDYIMYFKGGAVMFMGFKRIGTITVYTTRLFTNYTKQLEYK